VYLRTYGIPASLLQTRDGGQTFGTPLETALPSQGFALSPDGSTIVVSNPFEATFVGARDGFEFERVRCGGASCLGFAEQDLLGCGSEGIDGFAIGVSHDRGASFSRLLALSCVPGPVGCPEDSGVGESCPAAWPRVRDQIGAGTCSPVDVEPEASCPGEGGAAGAESSASSGGTPATGTPSAGGASGISGGRDSPARSRPDSAGCNSARPAPQRRDGGLLIAAAAAVIAWRRRWHLSGTTAAPSETARSTRSGRGHPARESRR
jgi:hypothetical protein